MERVFGEGRSGRGGKAIETGRMVKKKGSRRQECNRKLGVRRGDTGQGGEAGRKGNEKRVPQMGKAAGRLSPKPCSSYPSKPHRLSAPRF